MTLKADAELIELIRAGDRSAFKRFVETHQDKVYNLSLGFLNNREEAEDISQEVFIEVFHSINTFKGQSAIETWLYRITVNKSLERIKYLQRGKRFAWLTSLFGVEDQVGKVYRTDLHPGIRLENEELREKLAWALRSLPEAQQTAFTLSKFEQLTNKEIAEVMEQSLSAVESLLFRAKKGLQKVLKSYYQEYNG